MSEEIKAGWYPDPTSEGAERWWDGSEWTASVRPDASTGTVGSVSSSKPASSDFPRRAALLTAIVLVVGGGAVALWLGLDDRTASERPVVADSPQEATEGDDDGGEAGQEEEEEGDEEDVAVGEPRRPQPVDLRAVDWTTVAWTTSCTEFGDVEEVRLSSASDEGFGAFSYDVFPESDTAMQVYSVDHPEAFGDMTGDGLDEAVFITSCFLGNSYVFSVEVWSHDELGEPTHLPPVFGFTKFDGSIESADVVDGSLQVLTHEPLPGDDHPHLNGYPVEVVTDWQFVAQRWMADEASRIQPGEYGSDPYLDGLYDACSDGDIDSCEALYYESPIDSGYEFYGQICGERTETFCWLP